MAALPAEPGFVGPAGYLDRMGPLESTHPVAVHRRRTLGLLALTVTLVCSLLLVLMFLIDLGGAEYALLVAALPLLVAAPAATVLLRKARTPELIELYEGGIAHVLGGVRRAWTWQQVRAIDVTERGPGSYTGSDIDCTIRFDDGALVHFTGLTENSRVILGALGTHCAAAAREPVRKQVKGRAEAVLGAIVLAGGGVATWAVLTGMDTIDPDGSTHIRLAFIALVCAVPAFIAAILLVAVLATGRQR